MSLSAFVTGGSGFVGRNLISALVQAGYTVKALVRSETAAANVKAAGAEPVQGDLNDRTVLQKGMSGCDVVFHVAAATNGGYQEQYQANVVGTENVLAAAKAAGVKRLVHTSTEAVLFGKDTPKLSNADESWPLPKQPAGPYPATKGIAEQRVLAANSADFTTIIVRPRMIWGKGDTSLQKIISDAVKKGNFTWINGGKHLVSVTHVNNVTEGLLLAAEKGRGGEIYFVTDGEPIPFRQHITDILATEKVDPGKRNLPYWLATGMATVMQTGWKVLRRKDEPPLTPFVVQILGQETTIDDSKARRELGYTGKMSRENGLAEMRESV